MRVIEDQTARSTIDITGLRISTDELVSILDQACTSTSEVELTVGDQAGKRRTVLEGIDELNTHRASISIPCAVEMNGIQIFFSKYVTTIYYESDFDIAALALANRLRQYRTIVPFFRLPMKLIISATGIGCAASLFMKYSLNLGKTAFMLPLALIFLIVIVQLLSITTSYCKIYHTEKSSFIQKNMGVIFAAAVSALIASVATGITTYQVTKLSMENHASGQPD